MAKLTANTKATAANTTPATTRKVKGANTPKVEAAKAPAGPNNVEVAAAIFTAHFDQIALLKGDKEAHDAALKSARKDIIAKIATECNYMKNGKPSTAAKTYYALAEKRVMNVQTEEALKVVETGKKPVWSLVRLERGASENVASVALFVTKKAAEEYNTRFQYGQVVKGLQQKGQPIAAVA